MCHNLHQRLQSQSLHLSSRYHHFHGFHAVPGHGLNTFQLKWTNVQSRSQEVQDAIDVIAVHVTVVDIPGHVMTPDFQAVPIQSPFDPTLLVIVKYHISEMKFVNVMIILLHLPPIYLNLGTPSTTINLQTPTRRTTRTNPPTMTTAPPKSGSLGSLVKISPSLNITRILPDGLIIQGRTTNINLMMNLLPNILQNL